MSTIEEKLDYLDETKSEIATAITDNGGTIEEDAPFRDYAQAINDIPALTQDYVTEEELTTTLAGYMPIDGGTTGVAFTGLENTFDLEQTFNGGIKVMSEAGICIEADGTDYCTTVLGYDENDTIKTEINQGGDLEFITNGHKVLIDGKEIGELTFDTFSSEWEVLTNPITVASNTSYVLSASDYLDGIDIAEYNSIVVRNISDATISTFLLSVDDAPMIRNNNGTATSQCYLYGKKNKAVGTSALYDVTITTQAEFEELYGSSDWLGATSVAFVGDGGTLEFTRTDGTGILIPSTVVTVDFYNAAKINVDNFVYNSSTNPCIFGYSAQVKGAGRSMRNPYIIGRTTSSTLYGLSYCGEVTGFTGVFTGDYETTGSTVVYGMRGCYHCVGIDLTINSTRNAIGILSQEEGSCIDMTVTSTGTLTTNYAYGTSSGYRITSARIAVTCEAGNARGMSSTSASGNLSCAPTGNNAYGWYSCSGITNVLYGATSAGTTLGYIFYNCSYISAVRSAAAPLTAVFGGTNTYASTETIVVYDTV